MKSLLGGVARAMREENRELRSKVADLERRLRDSEMNLHLIRKDPMGFLRDHGKDE